ncbi:hypothetical protein VTO42DRAFT_4825 [Malbranchea cinnamomea]
MGCIHVNLSDLKPPGANQAVYREDCTQCFDSIDDPSGLNVCLSCFNGGCTGERDHAMLHHARSGHPLALNITRTRKRTERDEPPLKMSRLAIVPQSDEDRYNTSTRVICYACKDDDVEKTSGKLPVLIKGIMNALTFSRQEEVKAWQQEYVPCEHTLCLQQDENHSVGLRDLSQCSKCDLRENLWLCLHCGNIGCGRAQFGGAGGNSHALAHADASNHEVAVKLRSITPEGSADLFCYKCNEERIDPNLSSHLAHWGIDIAKQEKTEKSLAEMQIEHNLKWDFSMTSESGEELKPVFGAGFTGLKNLGNSCYLSSVLQCIFSFPEFQDRYFRPQEDPPLVRSPVDDLETQLRKVADGLISGRYSVPDPNYVPPSDSPSPHYQKGLAPSMLKHLVGKGHDEFSTMRQQDAFELLLHLFKLISVSKHPSAEANPINSFRFCVEQRLQCLSCGKVRYKVDEQDNISVPVPAYRQDSGPTRAQRPAEHDNMFKRVTLKDCLDLFTAEENVELTCPGCGSRDGFTKRSRFKTLPRNLIVNARRFELINWVPTKLNIPVEVGDDPFDMDAYLSTGPQEGEELLADEPSSGLSSEFVPNPSTSEFLIGMGFPKDRIYKALRATGNADPEVALNWLLSHMDDVDIDEPGELEGPPADDEAKIAQLGEMGIEPSKARRALKETGGDLDRALDWVFSHPDESEAIDATDNRFNDTFKSHPGSSELPAKFELKSIICHKGVSVHTGHYVAFVRKALPDKADQQWILFNDEKVVEARDIEEMKQFAYIYFFRRV